MKNILVIVLVLIFAAPAAFAAADNNSQSRYYVRDDDSFAVIYKGRRYGTDRDYRGYRYPNYNYNSPMSEFLSLCEGVKERKRNDCIQDAIKEREKLIRKYRD